MENGEQYFYSVVESFKSPNKDVEKKQKLVDFYADSGFIALDNELISKDSKELMQMYRLI